MTGIHAKRREAGFSILEVLLAVVILAVGILGMIGLQTTSLRSTTSASRISGSVVLGRSEMEYQRSKPTRTALSNVDCQSANGTGLTCKVTVEPCEITATTPSTVLCPSTSASPTMDRVTVVVTGQDGKPIRLQTIVARSAIAGNP